VTVAIRRAVASDAGGAGDVVCRSINELCIEDHRGDGTTIAACLANKTEANFKKSIDSAPHVALVAQDSERIVGFCRTGFIDLLYVVPEVRFQGVSKALLAAMERPWNLRTVGNLRNLEPSDPGTLGP
jgi:hypothetical protein